MTITSQSLIRWSGPAVAAAGLAYALVGVLHPPNVAAAVVTLPWMVVHVLAMAMCIFGLVGLAGLHARQAKESGCWGSPATSSLAFGLR